MADTTQTKPLSSVLLLAARKLRTLAEEPKRADAAELHALAAELDHHLERTLAGGRSLRALAPEQRSGGRPKVGFIVEHEQSGARLVWGAAEAAAAAGTTKGMVSTRTTGGKRYERVDRSGDGEWIVSVRRATPEEEAAAVGTVDAS